MLASESKEMSKLKENHAELTMESPYELSEMYFDSEIMKFLTEYTLRYILQRNNVDFSLSEMDKQKFIGTGPV